ncbi:processed acidic surface protein [Pseudalkalibacillus decolorationis]|uniref:processed acidic surface protein n=1 Tax=Pseudalkalibacillus decolorationis TaxID=163879 RepID=UPI0021482D97|nr:processed acidic surface protein [Pseudalkalibacillus decolorationis]
MKRVTAVVLALSIVFTLVPISAFAAIEQEELDQYLEQIRWTQEDLEAELSYLEMTLEDFESIKELKELIGQPLTNNNLQGLLDQYGLTRKAVNQLLIENGELEVGQDVLAVYSIYEELDMAIAFYKGTPIDDESMKELLASYDLTMDELTKLLEENEDLIENYETIEELDEALFTYMYGDEIADYDDLFSEMGLSEEELDNLMNYLMSLKLDDGKIEEEMTILYDRMIALGDFESATELTAEQIAELSDIWTDMLSLLQLEAKFYLAKDGQKELITMNSLLALSEGDAAGYDLFIELYSLDGSLLLDILLTAEMFGSELIQETGKDLKKAEDIVKIAAKTPPAKTEKGAKMPKTAGNYTEDMAFGILLIVSGWFLLRRYRSKDVA